MSNKRNNFAAPAAASTTKARIDVIPLFGTRRLIRDGDTSFWIFESETGRPVHLTHMESMFINAALHAAGNPTANGAGGVA